MIQEGKLWSRNFSVVMMVGLAVNLTSMMTHATLPLYIGSRGGRGTLVGMIMATFPVAALVGRPFSGFFLDRKGRRLVLVAGASLVVIAASLYSFSHVFLLLVAVRFLHGVGFSGAGTAAGTIVADITPSPSLATGIGYFGLSQVISLSLGPALGLFLVERYNFELLFRIVTAVALVALAGALSIRYEEPAPMPRAAAREPRIGRLADMICEWPAASVMLLITLAAAAPLTYLAPYAASLGVRNIGLFFFVFAVASSAARIFAGNLSQRLGHTKVVLPGLCLQGVGALALSLAADMRIFLVAAVCNGLSFGIVNPILNALIVQRSPECKRGAANATFFSAVDIGVGAGALLWGIVAERFGYPTVFVATVFVAGAAAVTYLAYYRGS